MYIDHIDGEECLVCELAKDGIPFSICNPNTSSENVFIYPCTHVAISKEAKDFFTRKIDQEEDWYPDIFEPDFTFETDDYKKPTGLFSYRASKSEGRKKIFASSSTMLLDTRRFWMVLLDYMPLFENEFLRKLDLTKPVDL